MVDTNELLKLNKQIAADYSALDLSFRNGIDIIDYKLKDTRWFFNYKFSEELINLYQDKLLSYVCIDFYDNETEIGGVVLYEAIILPLADNLIIFDGLKNTNFNNDINTVVDELEKMYEYQISKRG